MFNKDDFIRAALDAVGVVTGYAASEVTGEFIAKRTKQTGWSKVGIKAIIKFLFGILGLVGSGMTTGFISVFLFMFAVGAFAGIVLDVISGFLPGGITAIVHSAAVEMLNKSEIVVTSTKESPIIKW